jgi:thiosulfate dehydrogenase [quinone] large subunit
MRPNIIVGAMLMAGALTRVAALVSMGFSVLLMAMFGWQGATCIDEWTMAACNLATGATLLLGGSGAYSIDNVLIRRNPALAEKPWFRWMAGSLPLPLKDIAVRNVALAVFGFVLVFDIGTYNYYRGSVVTPFHGGPVSPTKHHLSLSEARMLPDGSVRFHVYLDAGARGASACRCGRSARRRRPASRALRAPLSRHCRRPLSRTITPTINSRLVLSGSGLRWGLPPP